MDSGGPCSEPAWTVGVNSELLPGIPDGGPGPGAVGAEAEAEADAAAAAAAKPEAVGVCGWCGGGGLWPRMPGHSSRCCFWRLVFLARTCWQ